jgi:hypothetical protein
VAGRTSPISLPYFFLFRAGIGGVLAAIVIATPSCGGSLKANPDGAPADGPGADDAGTDGPSADDAGACVQQVPAGATFTFHVRNDGTETRYMSFGCGGNPPIALETAQGSRGIGPESVYFCGYTCDPVFAGQSVPNGCTDCGPGVSKQLPPGATVDIAWDRRLWQQATISAACSGLPQQSICALGVAVAATMVNGAVTYCGTQPPTLSCQDPRTAAFVADLSLDAVEVSIQ